MARRYTLELRTFFRGRLPAQEADEATQLVLLHTVAQPGRFRGDSSFRHYVYAIARRVLADHFRHAVRNREDPIPPDAEIESTWDPPSQELLRREWSERLHRAIERLRVPYANVLELHLHGLDNMEIAAALQINYHTVRSRLSRAISALRQAMAKEPVVLPKPTLSSFHAPLHRRARDPSVLAR